jgi:magnesium-transporting ATPase (P-type)
MDKEKQEQLHM